MIAGVLLAAGRARRFGASKLMAPLPGAAGPVGVAACRALVAALPRSVAVVRPDDPELAAALRAAGAEIVECAIADGGMGTSLACGVGATRDAAGWVVALADMPWVATTTTQAVADALAAGVVVAAPWFRGQRGHPVGFGAACLPALLALAGDEGAKRVFIAHEARARRIDVDDPGCVRDVDRIGDLAASGGAQR
jgi:molybdenum cofactor cytidylyltransferase